MRIQYSLSILLGILVIVGACRDDASKIYMNGNDRPSTAGHAKSPNATALALSETLISGRDDAHTKNGHASVFPVPSSNGSHNEEGAVEKLASPLQLGNANTNAKSISEVALRQDEKKEEALSYSLDNHETWFHAFVNAVDNVEAWSEIGSVLKTCEHLGYLTRPIVWDDDQYTPLHYVAEVGDMEVVKELTEKHNVPVDIRTGRGKRTPLHLAALQGQLAVVEYLLSQRAFLHAADKDGSHPLHYAALGIKRDKNREVVAYLHSKGAELEIILKGFNLLHLAIKVGNISLVSYLLEQCPTLVNQEIDGLTPLAYAQAKHEKDIAQLIQKEMANQSRPCWQLLPNCHIH